MCRSEAPCSLTMRKMASIPAKSVPLGCLRSRSRRSYSSSAVTRISSRGCARRGFPRPGGLCQDPPEEVRDARIDPRRGLRLVVAVAGPDPAQLLHLQPPEGPVVTGAPEWSLFLGFGLYLLLMIVVGIVTVRYMRSLDDFVLGGRRLGPWVAAISERASGESAWFLLGLPGAAYAVGFMEFWSVIGIGFGIFFSWALVAYGLRRMSEETGALTIPDFLESRFPGSARAVRVLATGIILFFYTIYVGAQLVGAGKILHATFGLDPGHGMLLGAAIVVVYTVLGGFLAVAWTDLFQGLLMAVVAVVLPVLGLMHLAGEGGFVSSLAVRGEDFLAMNAGKTGRAFVFGVMIGGLSWGFGYFGQPHLLTRYMAFRRLKDIRFGSLIAMSWVLIAYWGAMFIGLTAVGVLGPDVADPDQVMPLLAKALVPAWIAGIMISGAVAAMMSTADSQLMVASSSLVEDLYVKIHRHGRPPADPGRLVLLGRIAAAAIAAVALWLAFANEDLIYDMVAYAWSGLGSSFGPVILLAIWWRGLTRGGVVAGMVVGMASTILWKNVAALQDFVDLKAASFVLALAAALLVSGLGIGARVIRSDK
ncbi:MAG: sodium/solute symporter [Candidatus Eisenbacteria bacterium]|nr:sodium/solute symporter [Candidatus Latescibacterota bacterium]MBD3301472.1 sodium/solute symporter [Candidatus Eisenbacteria bacterium]